MPKVRAVTYFISASSFDLICASAEAAVSFFDTAIAELKRDGHGLQMVRIATNTCEQWLDQDADVALAQLKEFDALCSRIEQRVGGGVAVIASLGNVHERLDDGVLVRALASTEHLFVCLQARHSAEGLPDVAHARRCAQLLLDLNDATRSTRGEIRSGPLSGAPYAFKLTVVCNTEPGGPFFPGAFSPAPGMTGRRVNPPDSTWSTPAFAFACENSDLLVRAFGAARAQADALPSSAQPQTAVLGLAAAELEREFDGTLRQLDQLGMALEALSPGVTYAGCDPSVASAAHPEESIVNAFDSIGLGPFGGAGTLTLSALVTSVLKRMPYRLVGYCGLMLPQTEDDGLARLGREGALSIDTLLLNSSVCGTGIDTVAVPGDASVDQLSALYCDVASMAMRLRKPLSCRVWPAWQRRAGDAVSFNCPFFVDSSTLALDPPNARSSRVASIKRVASTTSLCLAAVLAGLAIGVQIGRAQR